MLAVSAAEGNDRSQTVVCCRSRKYLECLGHCLRVVNMIGEFATIWKPHAVPDLGPKDRDTKREINIPSVLGTT